MSSFWENSFRKRMKSFESHRASTIDDISVSIKLRVESDCFHREHSPNAYRIIDQYLNSISPNTRDIAFEEHESGPEILVYLAVATAGLALAKSVVDLISVIIKARAKGIENGDHPSSPLELIIRRVQKNGEVLEEKVLRIPHDHLPKTKTLEHALNEAIKKLFS
jgi:hypothetical protein